MPTKVRRGQEVVCPACKGTKRCTDMTCWCLSDVCHRCAGRGTVIKYDD